MYPGTDEEDEAAVQSGSMSRELLDALQASDQHMLEVCMMPGGSYDSLPDENLARLIDNHQTGN